MWELDCEEGWAPKNWCFWTVVLEKTLECPLDCKEIQPVHSEGDQPWDFFGRNDVKTETPVLWPPHLKSWLIGKDSDAGRDWGQEEKGTTEDEMAGSHHWLIGRESGWTPGVGDGQGGLECCDSWGRKESDTTEQLNWTELNWWYINHILCKISSREWEYHLLIFLGENICRFPLSSFLTWVLTKFYCKWVLAPNLRGGKKINFQSFFLYFGITDKGLGTYIYSEICNSYLSFPSLLLTLQVFI